MSRSIDIDFTFGESFDVAAVIRRLMGAEMRASFDGEVSYLVDEDGMFDWRKGRDSELASFISVVSAERWKERTVGITLYFPDSDSGGDFLFHPGRETVSCVIGINPKVLPGSRFCDFGWYLDKLIPLLEPMGLVRVEATDSA
ncbi:hypothetical protein [Streptomyces sp. NPDC058964]|uniref:hypothetical protein n=1 Tax=Streptomyces sp. NPDC058964 TaxID=3346681 RepID=UPI003683BE90